MRQFMNLITAMPPVPAASLIPAIALLVVFSGMTVLNLEIFGFTPFIAAIFVMYIVLFAMNLRPTKRQTSPTHLWVSYSIVLCIPLSVLIIGDPHYGQRLYSVGSLIFASLLFVGIKFDRDYLQYLRWIGRSFETGQENAAKIAILGQFMIILLNETAIRYASLTEWISIRAVLPLLVSYLVWVTILATHPFDEEPDEG